MAAHNKIQEERNDLKTELIIKREAKLNNLEHSQTIHTENNESLFRRKQEVNGQRII